MELKNCVLYKGNVYKKIPESTRTYAFFKSPEDFLMSSLANADMANHIAMHVFTISKLLSVPSCRIIKNIKIDFNWIEVSDGWFFNIEKKRFDKNPDIDGSPRAFVLYKFENKVPYPKAFVEGR